MLSFGFSEIALIVVIIIVVIGPKEIPNLLRQIGSLSKSLKKASRQFKSSLNDLAEEGDFKDSMNKISNLKKDLDPQNILNDEISSIKNTVTSVEKDIKNINSKNIKDTK